MTRSTPPRARPVALALAVATLGVACAPPTPSTDAVAAFFPLAAVTRALAPPALPVRDLTPPGVEPHDLDVTSRTADAVLDARLAVVLGGGFQPGIEDFAGQRDGPTVVIADRLRVGSDPHVWLDPVLMVRVVRAVEVGVARVADDRGGVAGRADRLVTRLRALDAEYRRGLAECERRTIVTAHDAFRRLARRYRLRSEAIAGIDPEQEPGADRIGELTDLVQREGITTVFTEELVSPRVARTLAREAGVRTAVLDPLETAPAGRGIDAYFAGMRANLAALRRALGCR